MSQPVPQDPKVAATEAAVRRMASFAVMTVDWSGQRRSYLDNFLNYVLFVVPADSPTAFPRDAIRPSIIEKFNLTLPAAIVQQLVKRAIRLGLLAGVGEQAVTITERGKREVAPIPYTLKKLASEQVELATRFSEWIDNEFSFSVDTARATSMLLNYVETYYCTLMHLSDGNSQSNLNLPQIEPTSEQKVVAAFISATKDSDEGLFESIANLARGSMMVSALYAPTLVDGTRGFRKTTMYLDTKIVLRAMGYEGEPAEQSTIELIDILKRQGARVAVFEFTLREIQSVLEAVAQKARGGRVWDSRPGSVESYFYSNNSSNAQIEQHSVRVESKIVGLGMSVDPSPSYDNHRFVVDESKIEKTLLDGNPNYRSTAVKHDVELIAAIVRARGGHARSNLEESRATFVTLNSLVVSTANVAQREHGEPWPLVMFETDVAALTWIKEPLAAPNLPKNQLLATSLGLTNPGRQDWGMYIGEIGRLLDSGAITDNDLILLRQKYETDRLAFVAAPISNDQESKKQQIRVSIEEARKAVEAELAAPMKAERDKLQKYLEGQIAVAEAESENAKNEAQQLMSLVLAPIWQRACTIKWAIFITLIGVSALALLATFIPNAESWLATLPFGSFLVGLIRVVCVVAGLAGGLTGPFMKLGKLARQRYIIRSLGKNAVSPERAAEAGFLV